MSKSRAGVFEKPILRPAKLPLAFIPPMKPLLVDEAPEGDDWIHEIKYDGWRVQILIGDAVRAFTRNGHDYTSQFAPIVDAARSLGARQTTIDGELIVQGDDGRSDFHSLRSAITSAPERLIFFYAFDLLIVDGTDIRPEACIDRRARLQNLIGDRDPGFPMQFSEHLSGDGPMVFEYADRMNLEGIVSKKATSRYRSGEVTSWLKTKTFTVEEFVIVGHERGHGPTMALLARETEAGLEYAGGAFLAVDEKSRERFWRTADRLMIAEPPLRTAKRKGAIWLKPRMRARVKHLRGEEKVRHGTVKELIW